MCGRPTEALSDQGQHHSTSCRSSQVHSKRRGEGDSRGRQNSQDHLDYQTNQQQDNKKQCSASQQVKVSEGWISREVCCGPIRPRRIQHQVHTHCLRTSQMNCVSRRSAGRRQPLLCVSLHLSYSTRQTCQRVDWIIIFRLVLQLIQREKLLSVNIWEILSN